MDKDEVISTLNDLIETSNDGDQGFRDCAENTTNPELKSFFTRASDRCAEGARELQEQVRRLGGTPGYPRQHRRRLASRLGGHQIRDNGQG